MPQKQTAICWNSSFRCYHIFGIISLPKKEIHFLPAKLELQQCLKCHTKTQRHILLNFMGKMVWLQRDKSQRWQKGQNIFLRKEKPRTSVGRETKRNTDLFTLLSRSRTEGFELRLWAPSVVFYCMLLLVTVLVRRDMPYSFNIAPNNLFLSCFCYADPHIPLVD